MQLDLNIDKLCIFKDVEYKVVQMLDNNLMLAVIKQELDNGSFPLQTYIIPEN